MATPAATLVYAAQAIGSGWVVESGSASFTCVGGEAVVIYMNHVNNYDYGVVDIIQPGGGTFTVPRVAAAFNNWSSSGVSYGGFMAYANAAAGMHTVVAPIILGGSDGIVRVYRVTGVPQTLTVRTAGKVAQGTSSTTISVTTTGSATNGDIAFGGRCHENNVGSTCTVTQPSGWTSDIQYLNGNLNLPTDVSHFAVTSTATLAGTWTTNDAAVTDTGAAILVLTAQASNLAITTTPVATSTSNGLFATFSVVVSGATGTAHYQWQVDGVNVGPDSATLTYQPTAGPRLSSVIVSITDDLGTISSQPVSLRVHKSTRQNIRRHQTESYDNSGLGWFYKAFLCTGLFDPSILLPPTSAGGPALILNSLMLMGYGV